jgi:hypothetical protein
MRKGKGKAKWTPVPVDVVPKTTAYLARKAGSSSKDEPSESTT